MWRHRLASSTIAALALTTSVVVTQDQRDSRLKTAVTAVTVDVVVRDQRGNPVTDLRRTDFQLLEDGIVQEIGDVTVVANSPPGRIKTNRANVRSEAAVAAGNHPATSDAAPTFAALVFDRLSAEARALAHKGALAYLDTSRGQDFAGVFLSDLTLVKLQTFTTDRARVKKAIDEAATRVTGRFDRLRIGPQAYGDPDPGVPPTAGAEFHGRANPVDPLNTNTVDPGGTPQISLVAMMSRMERAFEAMARDQQGHATINSLMAVISALGELPGRKTVIFFAEALAIPPNVQTQFESVVASANRFNVSVYSLDAAGLPHAVLFRDLVIRIGKQWKGQAVLRRKLRLALFVEDTDAEHGGLAPFVRGELRLKVARFFGAAWGVVLWVEIEHDGLTGVV
jgi:VWFA-related protein